MRSVLPLVRLAAACLSIVCVAPAAVGQQAAPVAQSIPSVVRFTGTCPGTQGQLRATFGLYAEPSGGEALWSESQTVWADAQGRYTVLLGATTADGLPIDLFTTGAARWVAVRIEGQPDAPRVLLTSVPYALKAHDAETIAGRPLSAFVLAGEVTGRGDDGLTYVNPKALATALGGAFAPTTAGSPNYLGMFTGANDLGNSVVYQAGTSIGVNTTAPSATFHVMAPAAPAAFFDVYNNLLGALPAVYRAARGSVGAPSALQTDDILGGLAVRGHDGGAFSAGQGQVMFRAAQPWSASAHGTYLSITTTPLNSIDWTERIRVTPAGNVGIGTPSPGEKLSVVGVVESLVGGFKFPDGTIQTTGARTTPQNAGFGTDSLKANTTGAGNSAFGHFSLKANTGGSANTGIGYLSLGANTTGNNNTALGEESLAASVTGNFNTAVGTKSLFQNTASDNTAVGYYSLYANTTGTMNAALGGLALSANTTGNANTALGYSSLRYLADGTYNTAVGAMAIANATSGTFNSAFGFQSLYAATAASYNTGFGAQSLAATTTALLNTGVGYRSMARVTTGGTNSALGAQSLHSLTAGVSNSAVGFNSLQANAGGSYNSAFGVSSLAQALADSNAAFGYEALADVTTGTNNTAVGRGAGAGLVGGHNNTYVGVGAGPAAANPGLYNAAAIGANAQVGQNNSLVLGSGVNVGIGTSTPDTRLQVVGDIKVGTSGTDGCLKNFAGTGIAGTCSSDARLKTDVRPFGPVLDRLARLRPVHFRWDAARFPAYHFGPGTNAGLIAQEVERDFPELVAIDGAGFKTVNYSELPYLSVAAIGELQERNERLGNAVGHLRATLAAREQQIDTLEAQLASLAARLAALENGARSAERDR